MNTRVGDGCDGRVEVESGRRMKQEKADVHHRRGEALPQAPFSRLHVLAILHSSSVYIAACSRSYLIVDPRSFLCMLLWLLLR